MYCNFASYLNLETFLGAYSSIPDMEQCFNEIIRDGRLCAEYYDIDWKLSKDNGDSCSRAKLMELEQQVFATFLEVRSQFVPEYPVLDEHCHVLSASSNKKVSLHIVILQDVFEDNNKHMKAFMTSFKAARESYNENDNDAVMLEYIDMGVYTKNRGICVLGSSKHTDLNRKLVKADWHTASHTAQDSEFYITNLATEHTRVAWMPIKSVKNSQGIINTGHIAKSLGEDDVKTLL
ncbi:hypothetical protein BGZ98_001033, partial [Dissophora globulifera]